MTTIRRTSPSETTSPAQRGGAASTISLVAILAAGLSQNALAQPSISQVGQIPVGAGAQLQQIPEAPTIQRLVPDLPINHVEPAARSEVVGPRFEVKSLHVVGQTLYSESELIAATDFRPSTDLSLGDLRALATRISDFYNRNGYFLTQAYLPAQKIEDGVVTISVIEGRYGEVGVQNESRVSDGLVTGILDGAKPGDLVEAGTLERRLLLISDIPGVESHATMSPGTVVGTSDLKVHLTPGPFVSGSLEADNWGNPYTGAYRVGGTINFNNIIGYGDVLSLRTLNSTTGGMNYGRASYQFQVRELTLGVAFTALRYHLGEQFSNLNARGTEEIVSLYASYPLIRSRNSNLYAVADLDYRMFQDKVGATSTVVDRAATVLTLGLSGDSRDQIGGGGWNTYSIAGVFGHLDIQSPLARQIDANTAHTNGGYAKIYGSLSRIQNVSGPFSIYGAIRGQASFQNLDISEKMELGGASAVRAYPEGEAYGDQGFVSTLEARLLLPKWPSNLPGQVQLIGFVDAGYVATNTTPWYSGPNSAFRSGVGVGITWTETNNFSLSVGIAHRVGQKPTSAPDQWGRIWIRAIKYF